jgi:hypothetical protein
MYTNLALAGFVLSILGWASYVPVAKSPALRRNMWPTWLILTVATLLALAAVIAEPPPKEFKTAGVAAVTFVFYIFFIIAYFTALRIPQSTGRPEAGKMLPSISVLAETGQNISPDDFAGKGPVLLVFFRGFW